MPTPLVITLIGLQAIVVAFLVLHDWAPLGRLNDIAAVRAADPTARLLAVTVLSAAPFAFALGASLLYARTRFPGWLNVYLDTAYILLALGAVRAWWGPYLLWSEPARAERYEAMFGRTLAFLPTRNGIRPNTLHVAFHLVVLAILAVLALRYFHLAA
jgi:hypothetical protein